MQDNKMDLSRLGSNVVQVLVVGLNSEETDSVIKNHSAGHNIKIHHAKDAWEAGFLAHQCKPELACYLGYASPSSDPDRYIMCLRYLVQHLREHCSDGPLVINTMGWNRALGLQLLVDTIRYTSPTHIVQFETSRESRNIVPLTNEYLSTGKG
jgi:hypothetical protein